MAESFRAKKDGQVGFVHTINGEQRFIADVDEDGLSGGFFRLAHHEIRLVSAVDGSVLRDFATDPLCQCGE